MRESFRLPTRPKAQAGRDGPPNPHNRDRDRSRSPDRMRAPLRERNLNLLTAAGSSPNDMTMALPYRTKSGKDNGDISAWIGGGRMYGREALTHSRQPAPSIAASTIVSDADDITIKTFQAPVAMPAGSVSRYREARGFAKKNPAALRTSVDYMNHRAHLDAITTFWGGCPSKVLPPSLIPKKVRSPTAPEGGKYGPLDPMDWNKELVKGLRFLAPLCTAKDAGLWLSTELRVERRNVDTDKDSMTKHTVHAVYTAFVAKGYKPKTLTQAQKENKEKEALMARKHSSMAKPYAPSASALLLPSYYDSVAKPYGSTTIATPPFSTYKPGKPSAEVLAAINKSNTNFKPPWETDA